MEDKFIEVTKEEFLNFIENHKGLEMNCYMGCYSYYDWSLNTGKYKVGSFDLLCECNIARHWYEYQDTYEIREDMLPKTLPNDTENKR